MLRILMAGFALVLLAGCSTTTMGHKGGSVQATTKVTAGFNYDLDKEVARTMNAVAAACTPANAATASATFTGEKIVAEIAAVESVIAAVIKVVEQWKKLVDMLPHHTFTVTVKCNSGS